MPAHCPQWGNEDFPSWRKSGRSADERMVIQAYGEESVDRPRIVTGSVEDSAGIYVVGRAISNIAWMNIHFRSGASVPSNNGVFWLGGGHDILIEDCVFERYRFGITMQGYSDGTQTPTRVAIRRTHVLDSYSAGGGHSSGIYAYHVDGLTLEECVFDGNGWGRGLSAATLQNHNVYFHKEVTNVVLRGNIFARGSSHGISLNTDGLLENNLLVNNAIGIWVRTADVVVRDNVVLDGRDVGSEGRGFGILTGGQWEGDGDDPATPLGDLTIEGNVVAHCDASGDFAGIEISSNEPSEDVDIVVRDNVVHDWGGASLQIDEGGSNLDRMSITGNYFYEPAAGVRMVDYQTSSFNATRTVFMGNHYFAGSAAGQWFAIGGSGRSAAMWSSTTGEVIASTSDPGFPHPERAIDAYSASLGDVATLDAFMENARAQRRGSWDPAYTADGANDWIRAGFGR